jgi:hypothetical protein
MNAFNYPTFSVHRFVELRRRRSCSAIVIRTYGTYPSGVAANEALNLEGPQEQCFFFEFANGAEVASISGQTLT